MQDLADAVGLFACLLFERLECGHQTVGLFRQRRVAAYATLMLVSRVGGHAQELPQDARTHGSAVQALAPVLELT